MANKLEDINIGFLSLVKSGANRQPIQIYKSTDFDNEGNLVTGASSSPPLVQVTKEDKGILDKIKSIFQKADTTGGKDARVGIEKQVRDFNSAISNLSSNLWRGTSTLDDVLWCIAYSDEDSKLGLMLESIDQFKEYVREICGKVGIEKAVEGSPKSILIAKQVEQFQGLITGMTEIVTNVKKEEEVDMNQKEFETAIEPIKKSIESLTTQVGQLAEMTKSADQKATEAQVAAATTLEKSDEVDPNAEILKSVNSLTEAIKPALEGISTLEKSVESFEARLTKMENTVAAPAGAGQTALRKADGGDDWGGVFWPEPVQALDGQK